LGSMSRPSISGNSPVDDVRPPQGLIDVVYVVKKLGFATESARYPDKVFKFMANKASCFKFGSFR